MAKSPDHQVPVPVGRQRLRACYDALWTASVDRIRSGRIEPDPILASGLPDRRRGLTVIAQPSSAVRRPVAAFLDRLRSLEPDQHYYLPAELHVTVLSLFTATAEPEPFLAQTGRFAAAVNVALHGVQTVPPGVCRCDNLPGRHLDPGLF